MTPTSPQAWVHALQDADLEAQSRASLELFRSSDPNLWMQHEEVASALRDSVRQGNRTAASLLLLGRDASDEAGTLLQEVRATAGAKQAKLESWAPAAPLALVVDVALSRRGDPVARQRLLETLDQGDSDHLAFLLTVLRECDDATVIQSVGRHGLRDEHQVRGGVPSGAQPPRRVVDMAVDALCDRLNFDVSFTRHADRQYTPAEIQEVQKLLASSLPR